MYSNRVRYAAVGAVVAAATAVTSSVGPVAQADSASASIASSVAPALSASIDPALAIGPLPQSLTSIASQMAASAAGGIAGALASRAIQRRSAASGLARTPQVSGDSQFDAPTS